MTNQRSPFDVVERLKFDTDTRGQFLIKSFDDFGFFFNFSRTVDSGSSSQPLELEKSNLNAPEISYWDP